MKIPKGQIEWLINRLHVSATDEEISADMERRMKSDPRFTPSIKKQVIKHALKHHAKNQSLFCKVTTGRI